MTTPIGTPEREPRPINPNRILLKIPDLKEEKRLFEAAIVGQDEAVESFSTLAAKIKSGVRAAKGPIDVKFLAGPSGVGKTEIVKQLAEVLSADPTDRNKIIRIDAQEYTHGHEVAKLVGSPPGYRGSDDPESGSKGTTAVFSQANLERNKIKYKDKDGQDKDIIIVLVDEAEKGAPELHKIFLGILDEGRIQLGNNTYSDLRNAVIFYTSNVGNSEAERLRLNQPLGESDDDPAFREKVKTVTLNAFREAFPPEFRGRTNEMILFNPLKPDALEKIVGIQRRQIEDDMWDSVGMDIDLEVSPQAIKWLIDQGYNPSEGARGLTKIMKKVIADPIALLHTQTNLDRKSLYVDLGEEGLGLQFFEATPPETRVYREGRQPRKISEPAATSKATDISAQGLNDQRLRDLYERSQKRSEERREIFDQPPPTQTTGNKGTKEEPVPTYKPKVTEEVDRLITDPIRSALRKGVKDFEKAVADAVAQGSITAEQIGSDPRVIEIARERVRNPRGGFFSAGNSPRDAHIERDKLIRAGIGTAEDYEDLMEERRRFWNKHHP